ncbi:CopG family transcriptional regulator [Haloarcula halobia]|uniref:ribbon-helix-helix domain-containing protein n=1 Tax=Haloarcula halobia TaxID=3033388 RepID=UPI0023EC5EED|nr:CopG family transcriptional regulator [Halomicroarcula sp. XH51]
MNRFTISLDEELGEWVELQSEERGVSKSKVIRDAVEAAKSGDTTMLQRSELVDRIDDLENRVDALERERNEAATEGTGKIPAVETEGSNDGDSDHNEDVIEAFREWLSDRPPETEHGKEAMVETLRVLRNADGAVNQ